MKYGHGEQVVEVEDWRVVAVLGGPEAGHGSEPEALVRAAMQRPVGPRLHEVVKRGQRVAVITVDHTRPNPSALLWPVVERIEALGARAQIMVGLGNHRAMTGAELDAFLGTHEVWQNEARSPEQWRLGRTRYGTPIEVSPALREADRRIVVGFIEPHYIAGFSGGRKMILPGCASYEATTHNHFLTLLHGPQLGRLAGNPVHEDMMEAAGAVGVDWICDAVVNPDDTLHSVHCGDLEAAHREGAREAERLYHRTAPRQADIVICASGGSPYDIDMVQTKKALAPALACVRPGGVVVLVGQCERGWGASQPDRDLLMPESVLEARENIVRQLRRGELERQWPRCSPGLLFARAVYDTPAHLIVVSELSEDLQGTYVQAAHDLGEALEMAEELVGREATILVIPDGRRSICEVAQR